jgi:hypothetical protein
MGWEADLHPILRLLDKPNIDYIKSHIESGDANRTKKLSNNFANFTETVIAFGLLS